jgi:hypothetical protein
MHPDLDGVNRWFLICTCNPQAPVKGCALLRTNEGPTDEEIADCEAKRGPADQAHQAYIESRTAPPR